MHPPLETAADREAWYETPKGAFAFAQEQRLLLKMISTWPRRGHRLLEVGCGAGRYLELFWEAGFDVTGLERDLDLLEKARRRLADRVDLQIGVADALPYDDNTFDYVALAPPGNSDPPPHEVLREAVRVAACGVLLWFWNPFSLSGLCRCLPWCDPIPTPHTPGFSWRDYCALFRSLSPGCQLFTRSTLAGPPSTWRDQPLPVRLNGVLLPLPMGGVAAIRMEHLTARPLTGLPLRLDKLHVNSARAAAVMETSSKSTAHRTDIPGGTS